MLTMDNVRTLKQQQALETYVKAEEQAYSACLVSPTSWNLKSKEVQSYFNTEQAAWEVCNKVLREGTTTQKLLL